jgi:sporulation protein YlmC with PRC-barrel domain
MGSRSATELLQLPVRLRGIRLGRPVDLLLDATEWRALGFVVLCGDESVRFLVFPGAEPADDAIHIRSALVLLEDVEFYRARSRSLRELLGGEVVNGGEELGELRDLRLAPDGGVEALLVEDDGAAREVPAAGASVASGRVSPARG